jgi:hypothetical protein
VIDLEPKDFSSGLSFVAISHVKKLKGLAFCVSFGIQQLQCGDETESMKMLREDNKQQEALGFTLDRHGLDLREYHHDVFNE